MNNFGNIRSNGSNEARTGTISSCGTEAVTRIVDAEGIVKPEIAGDVIGGSVRACPRNTNNG